MWLVLEAKAYIHTSNEKRIFGLDLLRTLAILLVLVEHGRILLNPLLIDTNFFRIFGFWGVELFFVLSGFLIGTILIKDFQNGYTIKTLLNFWLRRWFRTLPNYYLILTILFIFVYMTSGRILVFEIDYVRYLIFSQNLFSTHPPFFSEAWSLCIEEWFYFTFPLMIGIIHWILTGKLSFKKKILIAIFLSFSIGLFIRLVMSQVPNLNWDSEIRKVTIMRMDAILSGVFLAWINYYYGKLLFAIKQHLFIIGVIILFTTGYYFFSHILKSNFIINSAYSNTFYFTVTGIGFSLLIPQFLNMKFDKTKNLLAQMVTHTSKISYSIYLTHNSIVLLILHHFDYLNVNIITMLQFIAVYVIATFFISYILYKFYEKPFMNLRSKFSLLTQTN